MNFFNSIFSDDPEPSDSPKSPLSDIADTELENLDSRNPNPSLDSGGGAPDSAWNFGSLFKTIATRSESVVGYYRRDFEEFGSGLLKETALIRDVASRAVKDFPDSIDVGVAVAQESLESMGQVIDNLGSSVWQGTNKIIARGKELHLFDDDGDVGSGVGNSGGQLNERNLNVKKYSWFDKRMREIQGDPSTYADEPDDLEDYEKWKSGFLLDDKGEEIENLMGEERVVERIYLELVPVTVVRESFWSRYFYKVDKLKQAEEARARIVKRAIAGDDEEELSWEVDDDEDGGSRNTSTESAARGEVVKDMREGTLRQEDEYKEVVESSSNVSIGEITEVGRASDASETNVDVQDRKFNEGKVSGDKNDNPDSCKDSDVSIVSTQPSLPGEEELGWDEIDDVGSEDENKITASSSSNISDLRKRLNAADEEEDLSWDIEDDDEPVKL